MKTEDFSKEDAPYLEHGMADKVSKANEWIQEYKTEIDVYSNKFCSNPKLYKPSFDYWSDIYNNVYEGPDNWRAFMVAWCDEFGGI
jgi:hypothetical protein